jgi:hypothetical protein
MSYTNLRRHLKPCSVWLVNFIAIFSFSFFAWNDADAATQRMFLPMQSFVIPPAGVKRAPAFCLDVKSDEPEKGATFTSVPTDIADISVNASGREMTLQEAINSKILRVQGNGGFHSLDFKSLDPSAKITVTIRKPSAILPDASYNADDLRHSSLFSANSGKKPLSQIDIWDRRAKEQLRATGLSEANAVRLLEIDSDALYRAHAWVKDQTTKPQPQRAFAVMRAYGDLDRPPTYLLVTGSAAPRIYEGNSNLHLLALDAATLWKSGGAPPPPRLVMFGEGQIHDFDAARLTIEVAGAGGGKGPTPPSDSFLFAPPDGSKPNFGDDNQHYDGKAWADLRISHDPDGRNRSNQPFGKRGWIEVVSRTATVFGLMTAAVRRVIKDPDAKSAPSADVIDAVKAAINEELSEAYSEDPKTRDQEHLNGAAPTLHANIDNQVFRQYFVNTAESEKSRPALVRIQ